MCLVERLICINRYLSFIFMNHVFWALRGISVKLMFDVLIRYFFIFINHVSFTVPSGEDQSNVHWFIHFKNGVYLFL